MGRFKEFYLKENYSQEEIAKRMFLTHVGNGIYKDKSGNKYYFDDKGTVQNIFDQEHYDRKKKEQDKRDKKSIIYALDKMDKLLVYSPDNFLEDIPELIQKGKDLYNQYKNELLKSSNPSEYHGSEQYRKLYPEIEKLKKELTNRFKSVRVQKYSNGNFVLVVNKKGHLIGSGSAMFGGVAEFKTEKEAKDYAIQKGYRIVK